METIAHHLTLWIWSRVSVVQKNRYQRIHYSELAQVARYLVVVGNRFIRIIWNGGLFLFWRLEIIMPVNRQIRRTNEIRSNGEAYGSCLRKEVAGEVGSLLLHAPLSPRVSLTLFPQNLFRVGCKARKFQFQNQYLISPRSRTRTSLFQQYMHHAPSDSEPKKKVPLSRHSISKL